MQKFLFWRTSLKSAVIHLHEKVISSRGYSYLTKWQINRLRPQSLISPKQIVNPQKLMALQSRQQVLLYSAWHLVICSNDSTEHQAEAESSALASTKKCAHCSTPEYDPEKKPFKPCPKCQTVRYCSRDCQKSGWKQHKKTCASAAQIYAQTADLKPASAPRVPKKDAHRGGLQKWQFDT
jgi:hypothetical protein